MFGDLFKKARKTTPSTSGASFAGRWYTTFGPMDLEQQDDRVHGVYDFGGQESSLEGRIEQGRLVFTYQEPTVSGEGWFDLLRWGKFKGQWREHGGKHWQTWIGERGFDGVWDTTFGLVRLVHDGDRVVGSYESLGSSTIEGQVHDDRLEFRYQEPQVAGEGHFTLNEGRSFTGEWRPDGATDWRSWVGRRVSQVSGQTWLVVIEAHWQQHLMDQEYSFGNMLKEFFARLSHVRFSHRFFSNEAGLRQWCRDLLYITDPVVVVIASHGTSSGLAVHGETISAAALSETLHFADNIQLLHFSACLTMQDGTLVEELRRTANFPFSGYTTSVDWAASAIAEFTYLDLILGKGLTPADAAAQLPQLLTFAGDKGFTGSAYRPAGFRVIMPEK